MNKSIDRAFKYWHNDTEWCDRCNCFSAVSREESCINGHPRKAWSREIRRISNCLRKGAHPVHHKIQSHALARDFLNEWHSKTNSWSKIASALINPFDKPLGMSEKKNIRRVTSLLNAQARGNIESDEVLDLLCAKIPNRHRRAATLGYGSEGKELAEQWDEISEQWDGLTGLVLGILNGKYKVVKTEEE